MPLPEPKKGESRQEYMDRCMSSQENEGKPQEQKVAICLSKYRNKKEK